MNKVFGVIVMMLVMTLAGIQFAKSEAVDDTMRDINKIGSRAWTEAMEAPWVSNDFYNNNLLSTTIYDVKVDKVLHNIDLRYDNLVLRAAGQLYEVVARADKYKEGDTISLHIKLKYEPVSSYREHDIFSCVDMKAGDIY